jgi:ABC-type transport system involved in cytochrome c biogenesis ATPase subunit
VRSISSTLIEKRLKLEDGRRLVLQRFACAGVGDLVRVDAGGRVSVWTTDGELPVSPAFSRNVDMDVAPGLRLPTAVHEISTQEHMAAYAALSQFHYRSDQSFGRRSILLLTSLDQRFPRALGFIEVTTSFLHLTNRSSLFDAPFAEPGRAVHWDRWDLQTRNNLTNVVARISRIVIHPEVRGLRLTHLLIDGATQYCATRWQVKGVRPLFLEITADMLKFMPFVRETGMKYIGESGGNFGRLAKDMQYLTRAREVQQRTGKTWSGQETHSVLNGTGKGILARQHRDINFITALRQRIAPDADMDSFVESLVGDGEVEPDAWELLLPMLRYPKPTYMKGLTKHADAFVRQRIMELRLHPPDQVRFECYPPARGPIQVKGLTLSFAMDTGLLGKSDTGEVRRAFGLERRFAFGTGVRDLTLTVAPGQICYVYGSSGSGKTSFLTLLENPTYYAGKAEVSGMVVKPAGMSLGKLDSDFADGPLVRTIGARSMQEAIFALNSAGLSEPRLYLSRYDNLSAGQRYRAELARLICSAANVWLLDEFASGLDDATAIAVGRSFAKAARSRDAICVVAAVRREPLVNAMEPDVLVLLDQIGTSLVTSDWREWVGLRK